VKGEGKLNMRIIFESVLMLFTQNYQNQSVLDETTACQRWLVFCDTMYPKLIKIGRNSTKFWQKQKCTVFETRCEHIELKARYGLSDYRNWYQLQSYAILH